MDRYYCGVQQLRNIQRFRATATTNLQKQKVAREHVGGMATIRDKLGHSGVKVGEDSVLRWPATGPQEVTAASSGPRVLCSQSGGNRERTSPSA